jgi:hypothetical protein
LQQHFIRGGLSRDDPLAGCGVDGDDVLHDKLPEFAVRRRFVDAGLLMSQGFRTSARKRENGFMGGRIVSSRGLRRNNRGGNVSYFNMRKIAAP